MDADETKSLPNRHSAEAGGAERKKTAEEPFAFGESTIFQLRSQNLDVEPSAPEPEPEPVMPRPSLETMAQQIATPVVEDPLVRIEQKLDTALRQLHAMQQRLESLDATIARALLR